MKIPHCWKSNVAAQLFFVYAKKKYAALNIPVGSDKLGIFKHGLSFFLQLDEVCDSDCMANTGSINPGLPEIDSSGGVLSGL